MTNSTRFSTVLLVVASILHAVSAVSLDGCSSQNFGASSVVRTDYTMSAGECKNYCGGSKFAIVSYQSCWCSNNLPPTWSNLANCVATCPGWPAENCAGNGYYGYISESANAQQAILNAVAAAGVSSSSQQPASSSVVPVVASTTVRTSVAVVASTNVVTSVAVITPISSESNNSPVTLEPQTVTSVLTSAVTSLVPVSASNTPMTTDTVTPTPSVEVITSRVTVSGAVVTQVLYSTQLSTPTQNPSSGEFNNPVRAESNNGLSNGAVAGITVGAIIGGLLLLGGIFLLWRRNRRTDEESGFRRQPSLLSRSGLLGSARSRGRPNVPAINTNIANFSGPGSAGTMASGEMSQRRGPVDGRLNPAAIMRHENASRSSVGTFQDHQDYSRPLEIRNPD